MICTKRAGQNTTVNASSLKVLIIDDEPVDREIFKQYLDADRPGAFRYAEAATGRDGLREQKSFNPDCILLDLNLPDLDGLKMIRLLREGRDMLPSAIVMLTGTGSEEVAVEAMKLGAMDYMVNQRAALTGLGRGTRIPGPGRQDGQHVRGPLRGVMHAGAEHRSLGGHDRQCNVFLCFPVTSRRARAAPLPHRRRDGPGG